MSTGLTLGGNTSPPNWEPMARARQQLANSLWRNDPEIIERAQPFLPSYNFAPTATPEERALFTNRRVFDDEGKRKPPTYDHHVDNNMYADITENMQKAAAASVIALYEIVGYPTCKIPDPVSWEKFESTHGHIHRVVGWDFNSRDLTFGLPTNKRSTIVSLLADWLKPPTCSLLEAAELHGTLIDASRANRKGRVTFFCFRFKRDSIKSRDTSIGTEKLPPFALNYQKISIVASTD